SPRGNLLRHRQQSAADEIVDVAPGADLRSVVVNDEILARDRPSDEVMQGADADLIRAIDVEGPQRHGGKGVLPDMRMDDEFPDELADGIGPARLADRERRSDLGLADIVSVDAIDLAGREVDELPQLRQFQRDF